MHFLCFKKTEYLLRLYSYSNGLIPPNHSWSLSSFILILSSLEKEGLKKEASLYKNIVSELDDALDNWRKMDEAAKGVADKAAQIEKAKLAKHI